MALNKMMLLVTILIIMGVTKEAMARDLAIKPGQNLVIRLLINNKGGDNGGAGMVDCWNALLELKSCTDEIILFFLDGEMYLGIECCKAIRIITRQCWPSMLTSIGFTAEEGDVLRGYCDGSDAVSPSPAPTTVEPVVPVPAMSPLVPLVPVVMG